MVTYLFTPTVSFGFILLDEGELSSRSFYYSLAQGDTQPQGETHCDWKPFNSDA